MKKLTMVEIAAILAKYGVQTKYYVDRVHLYCDATTRSSDLKTICDWSTNNDIHWQPLPHNPQYDKKVEIYQPTNEQLLKLVNLVETKKIGDYVINYVEFAVDFQHNEAKTCNNLKIFFARHLAIIHQRTEPYYRSDSGSLYYSNKKDFKFAMYLDQDNRKDKNKKSLHLEYRISSSKKVKEFDVFSIQNLLDFDHQGFWNTHLTLYYPNYTKLGLYNYNHSRKYSKKRSIERQTQITWGRRAWGSFRILQEFLASNPVLLSNPDYSDSFRRIITVDKFESYLKAIIRKKSPFL